MPAPVKVFDAIHHVSAFAVAERNEDELHLFTCDARQARAASLSGLVTNGA